MPRDKLLDAAAAIAGSDHPADHPRQEQTDGRAMAGKLDGLLDELECLMTALDPALQEPACDLAERHKDKLDKPR